MKSLRPSFGKLWAAMLWKAMQATGHGYRRPSMKNTGKAGDQRGDKADAPTQSKHFRAYQQRYKSPDAKKSEAA